MQKIAVQQLDLSFFENKESEKNNANIPHTTRPLCVFYTVNYGK